MGLFRKNGKQRMGQGIESCKNLNNWAHFFNPNSPSALQGEIACDIYWGRESGQLPCPPNSPDCITDGFTIDTTRGGNLDERIAPITYGTPGKTYLTPKLLSQRTVASTTVEKEATMEMVKFFLVVGAIAFIIYKFGK